MWYFEVLRCCCIIGEYDRHGCARHQGPKFFISYESSPNPFLRMLPCLSGDCSRHRSSRYTVSEFEGRVSIYSTPSNACKFTSPSYLPWRRFCIPSSTCNTHQNPPDAPASSAETAHHTNRNPHATSIRPRNSVLPLSLSWGPEYRHLSPGRRPPYLTRYTTLPSPACQRQSCRRLAARSPGGRYRGSRGQHHGIWSR